MMRILLALILPALLVGCSTNNIPIEPKSPVKSEDFNKLDDDHLCELSFVQIDPRIDKEIKNRKLYCDPADLFCRKQGFQRKSLAMIDCVYKEKLKNQSPNVKSCFDSGVDKGNIKNMTGCLIEHEYDHHSQQYSENF